jgi:phosphoribosylamine--glycine ligase
MDWTAETRRDTGVCVALASGGYPGSYRIGVPIDGVEAAETHPDVIVFHAGTAIKAGRLVTNGGRVLGVTAVAPDLEGAIGRAYDAIAEITFEGMHYRRDIGRKGLAARRG